METPIHSHADVMKSYLGLLCQGKSDFDHIEPFRKDDVFSICLQLQKVPSSPTLRQRLDAAAQTPEWNRILLRREPKETWLRIAETSGIACERRERKVKYMGAIEFPEKGFDRPLRQNRLGPGASARGIIRLNNNKIFVCLQLPVKHLADLFFLFTEV
jgi:hypothetical protein